MDTKEMIDLVLLIAVFVNGYIIGKSDKPKSRRHNEED